MKLERDFGYSKDDAEHELLDAALQYAFTVAAETFASDQPRALRRLKSAAIQFRYANHARETVETNQEVAS